MPGIAARHFDISLDGLDGEGFSYVNREAIEAGFGRDLSRDELLR